MSRQKPTIKAVNNPSPNSSVFIFFPFFVFASSEAFLSMFHYRASIIAQNKEFVKPPTTHLA
jgi:hypothetical protein